MSKVVFQMEPFSCPSCVKKIESVLTRRDGVEDASVLFHASKVKVEFDQSKVDAKALQELVVGLGYPVVSSKLSQ